MIVDGVVCHKYCPWPLQDSVIVPVLPHTLQHGALVHTHDTPAAGHQGQEKILLAIDVNKHCQQCTTCQQSKLLSPTRAPLVSLLIGKPWEMIAIDVLQEPMSFNGNQYLLVAQYYFTK